MSAPIASEPTALVAFAYGEHLEGAARRSLGFRMLSPAESWSDEVEAFARRLQSISYPEQWPATELFCSILLGHGKRLVAVARYGLFDHTAGRRRGGLELFGFVAPQSLGVAAALAVYRWLRGNRPDDLREMRGPRELPDVLSEATCPPPDESVPVLPIRLWQEGAVIFAANSPTDPDRRLGLLDESAGGDWQWLPLVGADFPLTEFANRGPVVAWTPHIANVALKLNQSSVINGPIVTTTPAKGQRWTTALLVGLGVVGAANLYATWRLGDRVVPPPSVAPVATEVIAIAPRPVEDGDALARRLYAHLVAQGAVRPTNEEALLRQYERMASDETIRVSSREAKVVIGLLGRGPSRSPAEVRNIIREVGGREFNPQVIEVLAKLVHQRLSEDE